LASNAIGGGADGDTRGRVCSPEIRRGRPRSNHGYSFI
jgi:hypothetical protein